MRRLRIAMAAALATSLAGLVALADDSYDGDGMLDTQDGRYFGMEAGPIWNNDEAPEKCDLACTLEWNGEWVTKQTGEMSICAATNHAADGNHYPLRDRQGEPAGLQAGPIFSNDEAQTRCPEALATVSWVTSNWITTEEGVMSVCACESSEGYTVESWRPNIEEP